MNILVVDDHPLTCAGLSMLLQTSYPHAKVEGVHRASQARQWLQEHEAEWIFLDVRLPDDPRCELFEWLRETDRANRVILVSAEVQPETVRYAIGVGARGFIPKSADPDVVLRGFATIRAGHVFLPERYASPAAPPAPSPVPSFSPRKEDVYRLLLKGHSNKLIARELKLSEYTVKEYVSAIFAARGVTNRLELILQDGPQRGLASTPR